MKKLLVILFSFITTIISAQPFSEEIHAFKKQDSISFPATNQILFVGSSSFTNWRDVQNYFPEYKIINRGFGGSSLTDVIRYANDIIIPYKPKQIIIYCGENDIAGDSTISDKTVFKRFRKLCGKVYRKLGNVPIVYISMKPSPSRWHLRNKMINGNNRIQSFLHQHKYIKFLNVWDAMLNKEGKPNEEIFLEDKLHMNAKGYAIWQKLIEPYLIN